MEDNNLIIFKAISNFVRDLNDNFGTKQRSLQLYSRLISKTKIIHEGPIKKHVYAFNVFCTENKDTISNKNKNGLKYNKITYSDKVYINIGLIFQQANKQEMSAIWKHLLTIMALLDPSSKAKSVLRESLHSSGEAEQNFLTNIIDKVETNIDSSSTSNPMEAVSKIMSSGIFTDLIGGMSTGLQSGELDLGKLMGSVQNMVGSLQAQTGGEVPEGMPDLGAMMGQMTNMMSNLQNQNRSESGTPLSPVEEEKRGRGSGREGSGSDEDKSKQNMELVD